MKVNMKFFVVLALSMPMGIDNCRAQQNRDCLSELKDVIEAEKKKTLDMLFQGKAWHVDFNFYASVKMPSDEGYADVATKGSVIATKKYRYVKEDQYEIYMDDKDVFTVNNDSKTVMRTASSPAALKVIQSNPYFDLHNDSLAKKYLFNTCREVYDSALKMKLVCYTILPLDKESAVYKQVRVYVDKSLKMVRKIDVWHNTHIVKDMQHCSIVFKSNGEKLSTEVKLPVKDMFIASNGQLRTPYHKYKYKDLKK